MVPVICSIELTRNQVARVDAEDFDALCQFNWYAQRNSQSRHESFYAQRQERFRAGIGGQRPIAMHRQIMGNPEGMDVDHINGDTLDNRRANLRVCTHEENCRNRKISRINSSGMTGVSQRPDNGKWTARIGVAGKRVVLGSFATKEEAIQVRDAAQKEIYGDFSRSVSHVV